jgi:hypothetical protein
LPRRTLGLLCGLVYGELSAASMIPLSFPDKRAALLGAFINRFSIGVVIGAVALPWPGWAVGLVIGVLLSLADAIITKAYAPILILGAVGGTIIGIIVQKFGHERAWFRQQASSSHPAVDDFVAARASGFNKLQQLSTSSLQ